MKEITTQMKFPSYEQKHEHRSRKPLTHKRAHWTAHNFIRQLKNIVGNRSAHQKLSDLVAEIVAIVSQQTVGLGRVPGTDLLQIHLEHVFGHVCDTQIHNPQRRSVLSRSSW